MANCAHGANAFSGGVVMRRLKMWQMILVVLGVILLIGVSIIGLGSLRFRNDFNAIAVEVLSTNTPDKKNCH